MKLTKKSLTSLILVVFLFILVMVAIVASIKAYKTVRTSGSSIDENTFQAVFLTNDQVYFGKLSDIDSHYSVLSDVYYVQLSNQEVSEGVVSPQPGKLVQLGKTEPHGPTNQMFISRDQILFFENLRPDSQVIRLINNLKQQD